VRAGRSVEDERVLELRYERLAADPPSAVERLAAHLSLETASLAPALARVHRLSVGRWRRDLAPEQLEDVDREAGSLLRELGYASGSGH